MEVVGDVLVDRTVRRVCGVYPCSRSCKVVPCITCRVTVYDCNTPVILRTPVLDLAKPSLVDGLHIVP